MGEENIMASFEKKRKCYILFGIIDEIGMVPIAVRVWVFLKQMARDILWSVQNYHGSGGSKSKFYSREVFD